MSKSSTKTPANDEGSDQKEEYSVDDKKSSNKKKSTTEEPTEPRGFDRGLEPEKIIGATDNDGSGEVMFLMKWKNLEEADLVRVREASVRCPQVVISFYEERLTWNTTPCKSVPDEKPEPSNKETATTDEPTEPSGFDRGLEPEKIIGATDSSGELMLLIKWKNLEEADLVPAKEANVQCPQVVIAFYEERLAWNTYHEDTSDNK